MIFRVSWGNALTHFTPLDFNIHHYEGAPEEKSVYVITFQEGEQIRDRMTRVCDSFLGQRFELPLLLEQNEKLRDL